MSFFDFLQSFDIYTNKDIKNPERYKLKGLISLLAFFAFIVIGFLSLYWQYVNPTIKNIYTFNDYKGDRKFNINYDMSYTLSVTLQNPKFTDKSNAKDFFQNCQLNLISFDMKIIPALYKNLDHPSQDKFLINYNFTISKIGDFENEIYYYYLYYNCEGHAIDLDSYGISVMIKHNNVEKDIIDKFLNLDFTQGYYNQVNKTSKMDYNFLVKNKYIQEHNKNSLLSSDNWKNNIFDVFPNLFGKKILSTTFTKNNKSSSELMTIINFEVMEHSEVNIIDYNPFYSSLSTIYFFYQALVFVIKLFFIMIEFRLSYFIFFNTLFSVQINNKTIKDKGEVIISRNNNISSIEKLNETEFDSIAHPVKFDYSDNIKLTLCCCRSKETILKSKIYSELIVKLKEEYFKYISKEAQYTINQKVISFFKDDLINPPHKLTYNQHLEQLDYKDPPEVKERSEPNKINIRRLRNTF